MKILLFGHRGQVGNALKKASPQGYMLFPSNIDITDRPALEKEMLDVNPDIIVNAAAYTRVDDAELNKDKAFEVNAIAPLRMAQFALKKNILLVHYSTDYVFDGAGYSPWTEDDIPAPLNTYGSTKQEGDQNIIDSGCRHIILRTSWVYGLNGKNFIRSILDRSKIMRDIPVILDQIGAPTSANFLADATYSVIKAIPENDKLLGLYHIAAKGEISRADFAKFIIEKSGLSSSVYVIPILSKDCPQRAIRPLNSRLNTTKLQNNFGIIPPNWKQDVIDFIQVTH